MPAVTSLNLAAECLVWALFLHLSLYLFPKNHILHLPGNVLGDFWIVLKAFYVVVLLVYLHPIVLCLWPIRFKFSTLLYQPEFKSHTVTCFTF